MKFSYLILCALAPVFQHLNAQTTRLEILEDPNKSGSIYYAYPVTDSHNTPAPEGYEPFYISHFGRHGSRYLISNDDYSRIEKALHKAYKAGALTDLGIDVMHRVDSVLKETRGRGGDLSPLGVRQHRGIAERMFTAYPEVFQDDTEISAVSTMVVRCVLSMDAFCERLKELNPGLKIKRDASEKYLNYLCYYSEESGKLRKEVLDPLANKYEKDKTKPQRLMASLFKDPSYVEKNIDAQKLTWDLFYLASDMQDGETKLSFYDIFTPDELFDLWRVFNFRFYTSSGNYPGNKGMMIDNASNLLRNFIETADEKIATGKPAATLRFGHDMNLMPFAGILEFEGMRGKVEDPDRVYEVFADYKISPMAGNVQMIFFRNPENPDSDILVKMMLNEEEQHIPVQTENWPFYKWEDVKAYYGPKIAKK